MDDFLLLPAPKKVARGKGAYQVPTKGRIALDRVSSKEDLFSAQQLRHGLPRQATPHFQIAGEPRRAGDARPEITLRRNKAILHEQGYRIAISTAGVLAEARTAAGMFYGVQTLIQIARQYGSVWPAATIEDWPDFRRRGVYHDVSRGKVPKLETILELVDDLASMKINEFQLYMENVYAFKKHPQMYDGTTPLTAQELRAIDQACRQRFIDFVPSLTSLGHFEKILSRPAFRHLAEAEPADLRKAGIETWSDEPWSLCVTDPGARQLLKDMYDEYLPNFSSKMFNICCDESWDLGKGRSKALADKVGAGKLYVDWVKYCTALAARHGRRIQMWGDIILRQPELIGALPKDATLLEWGYEADHPFARHCALLAKSGRPFYVAPGTSTWLTFAGRTENAFENMRSAAKAGLKYGAAGFLITDWGDHGHQQFLGVSLLPFAFGAAASWNRAGTRDSQAIAAANLHLFHDAAGHFAQALADLGQTYRRIGFERRNGSGDWFLFREPWQTKDYLEKVNRKDLLITIRAAKNILRQIEHAVLHRPQGRLIRDEAILTAQTIIYTAERTLLRKAWRGNPSPAQRAVLRKLLNDNNKLAKRFHNLWLRRNKPSRLLDVLYHFTRQQIEFRAMLG